MNPQIELHHGLEATLAPKVASLLGHKGSPYIDHVRDYLARGAPPDHDGLAWRFFLAIEGGEILGNICVWESNRGGILGHVYTRPEARGRGIARRLLETAVEDFRVRGGEYLHLNTEPESTAQRLYAKAGFQTISGVSGAMILGNPPPPATTPLKIEPFNWSHWPALNALLLHREITLISGDESTTAANFSAEGPLLQWIYTEQRALTVLSDNHGRLAGIASQQHPGTHGEKYLMRAFTAEAERLRKATGAP